MVVLIGAAGLGLSLGAGVLVLGALALSGPTARVGRTTAGEDGLPLVGSRSARFGDATAAARAAQTRTQRATPSDRPGQTDQTDQTDRPDRADRSRLHLARAA